MSATSIMQRLNRYALCGQENGWHVFMEDVRDPDGRWYRIEYRCAGNGSNANAYVRYNPWGSNPFSYNESHLSPEGLICVGAGVHSTNSPYNLEYVVKRARFWCAGYSFLRENGYARTCQMIPDW